MDTQFTDLSVPDFATEYWCDILTKSAGFTHLMKLVLLVDKYPEAMQMIKDIIINTPAEVNKQNDKGWSALLIACRNCNSEISLECINLLITSGADINICENTGLSCLTMISTKIFLTPDYVKFKIKNKYSKYSLADQTILETEISKYNDKVLFSCFNLLIKSSAKVYYNNALTTLSNNCNSVSFRCIKLLIELETDVRPQNEDDYALVDCCSYCTEYTLEYIKLLVELGIDVRSVNKNGFNALMSLCMNQTKYSLDCAKYLLDAGIDVNAQQMQGCCALGVAVRNICKYTPSLLKLLIDSGANTNLPDINLNIALHSACHRVSAHSYNCIKILIDAGADINFVNKNNRSPLFIACLCVNEYSYDCINLLIKSGADLNLQDKNGFTVFTILCGELNNYSFECIKLLVKSGADVKLKDNCGLTCLMNLFCIPDDKLIHKCAKFFIKSGADINIQSNDGASALMYACNGKYYKAIELLINSGADINLQDNCGNTALHVFCDDENLATANSDIIIMFMYKNYDPLLLNNEGISVYQYFSMHKNPNLDNEYIESLLQGKIRLSNTKSSRK